MKFSDEQESAIKVSIKDRETFIKQIYKTVRKEQ